VHVEADAEDESMRCRFPCLGSFILMSLTFLVSCASTTAATPQAPSAVKTPITPGVRYTDEALGFSLDLPTGWIGQARSGPQGAAQTSDVTLIGSDQATTHSLVQIGVMESAAMVADFARLGRPTTHIGSYPAFSDDRAFGVARVPCLVRIFLVASDYVIADWCAVDALQHAQEFEQLLASYRPAPGGFVAHVGVVSAAQSCAQVQSAFGYASTGSSASWGKQLAAPGATAPAGGWNQLAPGLYLCSNRGSTEPYLFQCAELVNRYLYERWALPHLPGNAARYMDYYQDGALHRGAIDDFPASVAQVAEDASQGTSAFAPQAGDLLVFQDVRHPRRGWTSGLTTSPGHVALITKVTATQVLVAQENYNDTQFFEALSLIRTAQGYHIVDRSGLSDRITRGWIHFAL
jgi:hypothetical protein